MVKGVWPFTGVSKIWPGPFNLIMEVIDFFWETGKLKRTKRKGWLIDGVENPESVAEHSFRVALMTLVLAEGRDMDLDKAINMVLIHDLTEAETRDMVEAEKVKYNMPGTEPERGKFDLVSKEEKNRKKEKAAGEIFSGREELLKLWKEYQKGESKESSFAKQVDKLETVLQALKYEKEGNYTSKTLQHYFEYGKDSIEDPELVKLLEEIYRRRPK